MRRLGFFLLFVILLSQKAQAQYLPLVDEGHFWIHSRDYGGDFPAVYGAYVLYFAGDTTIAGKTYHPLYEGELAGGHPCPPEQYPCFEPDRPYQIVGKPYVFGFFREDTSTQQVFVRSAYNLSCASDTAEVLLFDFAAEVGDTLPSCVREILGGMPEFGVVRERGRLSVYGVDRPSQLTLGYPVNVGLLYEGDVHVLQGFGLETGGLVGPATLWDYCYGSFETCDILSSLQDQSIAAAPVVYPNPFTSSLHLSEGPSVHQVSIFTAQGQHMATAARPEELNLAPLPAGPYVLHISFVDGSVHHQVVHKAQY